MALQEKICSIVQFFQTKRDTNKELNNSVQDSSEMKNQEVTIYKRLLFTKFSRNTQDLRHEKQQINKTSIRKLSKGKLKHKRLS